CTHIHIHTQHTHTHTHIYTHTHTYIYTHNTHTHIHTHYTHIHTQHTHTHTHTCAHTIYKYTYICFNSHLIFLSKRIFLIFSFPLYSLSNCSITEEGFSSLASALRSNPSHMR